ncbi:SDR family NAD(P)-dependent oxidoreductase [Salicibibacter halophilus]|uniref:SDR family NAD(P)-dependent oxidoreductase n=1 Tax=Salicibibacter halophilus TaxID=2502791 RepID=A0A514LHQ3_9BACI|nr:SDR family NAD(P)-dependent oxidoreductase [Salicibibacter halophilus]
MAARRLDKLNDVKSEMTEITNSPEAVQADMSDRNDVNHLAEKVQTELGYVDIFVNNAGHKC